MNIEIEKDPSSWRAPAVDEVVKGSIGGVVSYYIWTGSSLVDLAAPNHVIGGVTASNIAIAFDELPRVVDARLVVTER